MAPLEMDALLAEISDQLTSKNLGKSQSASGGGGRRKSALDFPQKETNIGDGELVFCSDLPYSTPSMVSFIINRAS